MLSSFSRLDFALPTLSYVLSLDLLYTSIQFVLSKQHFTFQSDMGTVTRV